MLCAQSLESCLTLCDLMDCSLRGSSVHGILQARICVCSVVSDSLQSHGLQPIKILGLWNSPGKNTGVSSHPLPQEIFLTQGSNPGLLLYRQILYHLSHQGALKYLEEFTSQATLLWTILWEGLFLLLLLTQPLFVRGN